MMKAELPTPARRAAVMGWLAALLLVPAAAFAVQTAPGPAPGESIKEHGIFPGRTYDPAVPSPSEYLGYGLGEHLATYGVMAAYLERLAASSDRVHLDAHGESYEGRTLYHVTISSPENLRRLDEIRADLVRLADPRALEPDRADRILERTPAVVMLNFGTDGAETAGPEGALHVAYQLAAATDDGTRAALREVVVVIVPAKNPDSNQRTVAWYNAFRVGPEGTEDPDAAEHHFPWGINSNNRYQIDMNRESVWSTQRETRHMVALYRRWNPQVFVDNHGQYPAYTGPWYSEPLHEQLTARQREWLRRFGEAMGRAFAEHGYLYSAWEFGQFDPGYWDTYPNFSGAIAWTTETTGGGNRGLRLRTAEGVLYTLEDGIIQHVIASDLTVRVAAEHRAALLRDFLEYKRTAIEEGGQGPVRAYALSARNDPERLASVINALRRNAIDVYRTTRDVRVSRARPHFQAGDDGSRAARTVVLPAGSYILPLAQPEGRMLRVLMEPDARFSEPFLQQVEEARLRAESRGRPERIFYDITGWSMPLTYHLEAYELADAVPPAALEPVTGELRPRGRVVNPEARHGFLVDYGSNAALHALGRFQREGIRFRVATAGLTVDGRRFPAGTLAVFHRDNPGHDLSAVAGELAANHAVTVVGVDHSLTEAGPHLGSGRLVPVQPARIAVVMDRPIDANGYGHIWYTFERIYRVDFTALNFDRLPRVDLRRYDVLILPDGNYGSVLPGLAESVAASLRDWVRAGGTLIGIRGGAAWIAREELGLTAARIGRPAGASARPVPLLPGTILRARIADPGHPLVFGYEEAELPVTVWSRLALDTASPVEAPVRIVDADVARVSGFAFPESLELLERTPYVVRDLRGDGAVILFLDDPNFRLFWEGLTRMFFNAVFLGRL